MFHLSDMETLTELVATAWLQGRDSDWSVPAGTLDWSCRRTAEHAVDTVIAPALFLASRNLDRYPPGELAFDAELAPERLVEGLRAASRILAAVVTVTDPDVQAIIWLRPEPEARPAR